MPYKWGLVKFFSAVHKLVSAVSISTAVWYSRCFQHVAAHNNNTRSNVVELRKRSRSEDGSNGSDGSDGLNDGNEDHEVRSSVTVTVAANPLALKQHS